MPHCRRLAPKQQIRDASMSNTYLALFGRKCLEYSQTGIDLRILKRLFHKVCFQWVDARWNPYENTDIMFFQALLDPCQFHRDADRPAVGSPVLVGAVVRSYTTLPPKPVLYLSCLCQILW